jgi:RES domain-containing protein
MRRARTPHRIHLARARTLESIRGVRLPLYIAFARRHAGRVREGTAPNRIDAEADRPKDLVSLTVGVARVLDLTDPDRRKHFGIALETLTGDAEDDLESCRIVADIARLEGYDAILSPSAALDVGRNLNLYIDGRADHLRLMDGPDRIPLNYDA